MKQALFLTALLASLSGPVSAACYADYTASRSDPYDLHYGVAQIFEACTVPGATSELDARLAAAGWQLLEVRATFDLAGAEQRKANAGDNYLRY